MMCAGPTCAGERWGGEGEGGWGHGCTPQCHRLSLLPPPRLVAEVPDVVGAARGEGHPVEAVARRDRRDAVGRVVRLVVAEVDGPRLRRGERLRHALEGVPRRAADGLAAARVGDVARDHHRVDARVGEQVRDRRVGVVVLADVADEAERVGVDRGWGRGGGAEGEGSRSQCRSSASSSPMTPPHR